MDQTKIDRINQLARLAKERDLTPEELAQREALRSEYRAAMRASLEAQLDRVYTLDDQGREQKCFR